MSFTKEITTNYFYESITLDFDRIIRKGNYEQLTFGFSKRLM